MSDAVRAFPGAAIDWIVEEPFAGVARLHRAVRRVIPVAMRRWRAAPWRRAVWSEIGAWRRALRSERYDAVLDTQSLVKSALLCALARGARHGMDAASAREPLAAVFYGQRHSVPRWLHAVERNRHLAAEALGYPLGSALDYGLQVPASSKADYVVLLTMTSRADKLWPEARWIELARALRAPAILPWGTEAERSRAERIAGALSDAKVSQRLSLEELSRLLVNASRVIGLDTGLTHFAAALGAPTVGIYCGSDPALTGLYGAPHAKNVGAAGHPPEAGAVLQALE